RDHVTGLIHDLPKRSGNLAADALRPAIAAVFAGPDAVRTEAVQVVAKLGMKDVGPLMAAIVKDAKAPVSSRAEALQALAAVKEPPELLLDVLDAAETRIATPRLKVQAPLREKVDAYRAAQSTKADDKLAPWAESLAGGNPEKGRDLFLNSSAVYCQRCHRLD